jgi:TM2 domain-containing membrane protein YozV
MKQCSKCGAQYADSAQFCAQCGSQLECQATPPPYGQPCYSTNNAFDASGPEGKSRGVAALLAILLGSFGVHYFYLGKVMAGVLTIVLSLVTCGIWPVIVLIQGILMFCMTNDEFQRKYVQTNSSFPLF